MHTHRRMQKYTYNYIYTSQEEQPRHTEQQILEHLRYKKDDGKTVDAYILNNLLKYILL